MSYSLHRGAERDLLEAATFYRREGGTRLANRFLDEFARVADLRVAFPAIGTSAHRPTTFDGCIRCSISPTL